MPVDTPHHKYSAHIKKWQRVRDVLAGEDAVKAQGAEYLPILGGQTTTQYEAYKRRALFYNASARTVKGLVGAIHGKPPQIELPGRMSDFEDAWGAKNESIKQVAKEATTEVLSLGRLGLYVDAQTDGDSDPFVTLYFAENIINWRTTRRSGRDVLNLVVLREEVSEPGDDQFVDDIIPQFRVLKLVASENVVDDEGNQVTEDPSVFIVEIWRKDPSKVDDKEDQWVLVDTIVPRARGGRTFDSIPFVFINPDSASAEVEPSPILDMVNVNLSHYRTSADLEHGRHFTALPTAWVAGFDPETTSLVIGSQKAWVSENENAQAGFLEFTGKGLGHLSDALKEKQQLMAVLGARLLEEQKADAEAAETVRLRHTGERSILAGVAAAVSEGIKKALEFTALYIGAPDASIGVQLNDDFNLVGLDHQTLQTLMAGLQEGSISWDTFFFNLKRGEFYPEGRTAEEEQTLIELNPQRQPGTLVREDEEEDEEDEENEEED